jgi:hypothetical protein
MVRILDLLYFWHVAPEHLKPIVGLHRDKPAAPVLAMHNDWRLVRPGVDNGLVDCLLNVQLLNALNLEVQMIKSSANDIWTIRGAAELLPAASGVAVRNKHIPPLPLAYLPLLTAVNRH